jgi:hypothetical protein
LPSAIRLPDSACPPHTADGAHPKLPAVLMSSMEEHGQESLLSELESILGSNLPPASGIVDATEEANFASAAKATGRKKPIVAGRCRTPDLPWSFLLRVHLERRVC